MNVKQLFRKFNEKIDNFFLDLEIVVEYLEYVTINKKTFFGLFGFRLMGGPVGSIFYM